ncbi:MAG: hypothetical protein ACD_19C00176G0087 [uncultured bacterium]|nr:MAG: hypothetical protein ACD_19C00176G0087 [uncultured bacterium]
MVIANVLGIFILFYLLWRTLKDDYHYEKIFNLAFAILFGFIVGSIISKYVLSDYWFWLSFGCILLGFFVAIIRQRLKFYETFEALVVGVLPWISIVFLVDSINNSSLSSFITFWIGSICFALFFFFKSYYRTFTWYKSGRVGFAGILTATIFFLARTATNHEPYLSGSVALLLFLVLYKLSKNEN